jgi:hypothetical protein
MAANVKALAKAGPFREGEFLATFMDLMAKDQSERALTHLLDNLEPLGRSGLNRKEKLNHLLFMTRMIQNGGVGKHGAVKLIKKAEAVARALKGLELDRDGTFLDFGTGQHDTVALATYFYLNGFRRAIGVDMSEPRNAHYSALSMRDILLEMHARPQDFLLPGSDLQLFQDRLAQFDLEAFAKGDYRGGFAGTNGGVEFLVSNIVNTPIVPGEITLMVSFAVFEHVSDMDGVLAFLHSRMKPGALAYHYIDMADHRAYRHDGTYNHFSFLAEVEAPANLNRIRKSEFIAHFQGAGFEILKSESSALEIPEQTRAAFVPRFATMSEDDQTAIALYLTLRCDKSAEVVAFATTDNATSFVGDDFAGDDGAASGSQKGKTSLKRSELGILAPYRVALPQAVENHPSMMSGIEREVLYGLASRYYKGEGAIIDAGVFLGASTRILGYGLRANEQAAQIFAKWGRPITTYEHGILGPGMPKFFEQNGVDTSLVNGDSFEPLLRSMIGDVLDIVDLKIGDILTGNWTKGQIELLFLDVIKSYEINAFVIDNFYTKLIPGKSLIIQQDYFIDRIPHLKVTQEFLAPYCEYIGNAQSSGYFLLKEQIPATALAIARDPESLPYERQQDLIRQCVDRVRFDPDRAFLTGLSLAVNALKLKGTKEARAELAALGAAYPDQAGLKSLAAKRVGGALDQLHKEIDRTEAVEIRRADQEMRKAEREARVAEREARLKSRGSQ